ncbi:MAG: RidA family protein [Kiritimatiellales bacterium]|nr:RidA family protein [Kiritimatiellales bacterium]
MKTIVNTDHAPAPIGPYNQAVKCGTLLFTSGQIPINPVTGELIDGTIEEQTRQVLDNLKAVVEFAGSSLDKAVKTTVFLSNMAEFPIMNAVYAEYFGTDNAPARSTVQVAALPKGVKVEIELIVEL